MKGKIPDRWLEYTPMGSKVAGTRFIAFKAPLSKDICTKIKPAERFTPDILMERCPNMRLIIDLTNTDRYYNKQEFIDRGIQYEKIMCPGQVIPPQSLIFRFFEIIDDFYLKNGLKDVLIGIHCTHGVNRTGYFIGRYMVQRMGFHFEKAIPCIEEARGHKIERTNYIKDLMIQVPIPSSLSSSGGKKPLEIKPESKKLPVIGSSSGKVVGKMNIERTPEKQFSRKPPPELRDPPSRRTPSPSFRPREPPARPINYVPSGGRPFSPVRRVSPVRRGLSPVRRGFSPGRRPPSPPVRRGMRGPSPKRLRTPPRPFSPPRRRTPPRRSPPRRMSPPRREGDFGPSSYRDGEERDFNRGLGGPNRGYSPPRRIESQSRRLDSPHRLMDFPSRGPPERQNYGHPLSGSFQPPYEKERGFNGPPSKYGPPTNNFSDSRPPDRQHPWDNRSNNQPTFNESRSSHPGGTGGPSQWNQSSNTFTGPSPNFNTPPPSFESHQGGYNTASSGRFNDRRFDEPKFPPSREETRRSWNDDKTGPNSGPPFNSGRYEDNRNFSDRGKDYRGKPDDKPYRSPPRGEYSREKRPPSPIRDSRRNVGPPVNRPGPGFEPERPSWDNRRRSPDPSFGEYPRDGGRRRSRSPGRRPSPPVRRRSRSPVRRSPPRFGGMVERRSPPRNRTGDGPPRPFTPPFYDGPPPRSGPEPPFQDKRYYESKEDCRDLLNQKRHFEGADRSNDMYNEPKPGKLDLRDIPKEVDLRKVIRGGGNEPPLKDRLGPHPRDERSGPPPRDERFDQNSRDDRFGPPPRDDRFGPPLREDRFGPPSRDDRFGPPPIREDSMDGSRRFGRGRSRSPRGRSPTRYGPPPPMRRF